MCPFRHMACWTDSGQIKTIDIRKVRVQATVSASLRERALTAPEMRKCNSTVTHGRNPRRGTLIPTIIEEAAMLCYVANLEVDAGPLKTRTLSDGNSKAWVD